MNNVMFKEIEKIAFIFAFVLAVLLLLIFNKQPEIAIAFLIGMFLGVFRLKAFFSYVSSVLNNEESNKNTFLLLKYLASSILTLGVMGFVLYKSAIIGLSMVFGLVAVPIILMFYALWKGISLFREN